MAMHPRIVKLGQTLVKQGTIDEHQLTSALANAEQWGMRLGKTLVRMRLVRESALVQAIAEATGFQAIDLTATPPEPSATHLVDEAFCRDRGVFPLAVREKAGARTLFLAMADPTDMDALDLVAARIRGRVKPFVASEQIIEKAIEKFFRGADVTLTLEEEAAISEMDEMKLVDVNGRTMHGIKAPVIHLKEEAAKEAAQEQVSPAQRMAQRFQGAAPPVAAPPPVAVRPAPPPPAGDPLGDFLGGVAASAPATNALEERLARVEQHLASILKAQETTTNLVRALAEILIEKRYVTSDEIRARAGRR